MPIKVKCPNCGASLSAPESALGKKGRCKHCRATLTVTNAGAAASEEVRPQHKCVSCGVSESDAVLTMRERWYECDHRTEYDGPYCSRCHPGNVTVFFN